MLKSIEFEQNSMLQTISKYAFEATAIESIVLPSSVVDLKDNCFCGASNLKTVDVDVNNPNIKLFDGKFLVCKSDPKSDVFDVLHFANRNDIKNVTIPSCVKRIAPYSFSSESASFESITISPQVTEICDSAFAYCSELCTVIIAEDSQLKIIGEGAFFKTPIRSIVIPPHVERIGNSAFSICSKLRSVTFSENSELSVIERDAFAHSSIHQITIPRGISIVPFQVFNSCKNLRKVEFAKNSILENIGERAFAESSVKYVRIPKNVKKLCHRAFFDCKKLKTIEFEEDSELRIIEKNAFGYSTIEYLMIPSKVINIDVDAFFHCKKIRMFEVCSKSTILILLIGHFYDYSNIILLCPPK